MPSIAASSVVSAITEAPVSTMNSRRRPSTRPSTRKCPCSSRGTTIEREFEGVASTGITGRAVIIVGAGRAPFICAAKRGTMRPATMASAAKVTTERMDADPGTMNMASCHHAAANKELMLRDPASDLRFDGKQSAKAFAGN